MMRMIAKTIDLQIVNIIELFVVIGKIFLIKLSVHEFDNAIYIITIIHNAFISR